MSELSGKFKADLVRFETSEEGAESPFIRALFILKEELVGEDWEALAGVKNQFASRTYWLHKTKKNAEAKDTAYNYSRAGFKRDFDVDFTEYTSVDGIKEAVGDVQKVLFIQPDESSYHNIKYINKVGGKQRANQASWTSLR